MIDYWRLCICISKIKITGYKDYKRLHWDYSPVADPLTISKAWYCCVPYAYFIPYMYGTYHTRIRIWYDRTHMVWLFVPYAYSFTILLLFTSNIYIAITNTVLLFVLDHVHSTAICSDALCGLMHSDKLIISGLANNPHLAWKSLELLLYAANYNIVMHVFACISYIS